MMSSSAPVSDSLISAFLAAFPDVLERVPAMAWMTDVNGSTTFVNRRWLAFVGRTIEQERGWGWAEIVHPDDREACLAAFRQAHASQTPFDGEYRWRRGDGTDRLLRTWGVPLHDPSGTFVGYVGLGADVTDEDGAAKALARTSDHLHLVASNAEEMIYRLRLLPTPMLEYISPGSIRITGYEPEAFIANRRLSLSLVVEEDRWIVEDLLANPTQARRFVTIRWRHRDGHIVWAEHTRVAVRDATGTVVAIEGVARDVTLQKQLERERDEHSTLLTSLIANMSDAVLVESDEGRVLLANDAFCRLFGLETQSHELIGADTASLTDQLNEWRARQAALKAKRRRSTVEEITLSDGRVLELQYAPVRCSDDVSAHLLQFRDISARKLFEAELHTSRQRIRELAAHAEAVREEERRGAAQVLHDEVGQLLTAVKLELAAATDVFRAHPDAEVFDAVDRLQSSAGLVDVCLRTVQRVSAKLQPTPIAEMRISSALRYEALLFERRSQIRCRVRIVPPTLELDAARSAVAYRVLLESLTNVTRHAAAGAVHISLKKTSKTVVLAIRDNGRGIAQEQIDNPRTMGLLGMRERALAVGGDVQIARGKRGGTTVTLILPLDLERSSSNPASGGAAQS